MPAFALRNPYLIVVGALMTILLGVVSLVRMPIDVFPPIDLPAVVVATFYNGMPPVQVERDITTRYERFFTLASGIEHTVSRSLPGVSLITLYFHPGVDPGAAASTLVSLALANLRHMPPGTLPPMVLQAGAGSLPVVLVALEGEGFSEATLRDQAQYNVRNWLATVSGASVPPPFGGKVRQIMAYLERQELQARGMTFMDVVETLNHANLIVPAGDMKIGDIDYFIDTNAMIDHPSHIDNVPTKVESAGQVPVFVGDVGRVEDAAQIQYNIVRVNGQRSVYIPIMRQGGANTISVVDGVKALLDGMPGVPSGIKLKALFDQSEYIRAALRSLTREAVTAALLATATIFVFLGNLRAALAVFLAIALSLLAAAIGLSLLGATINIMTLGGAALAIGRLVDDTVVVLENVDRYLLEGMPPPQAALAGASEVTFAVLASTLTTVIVLIPTVFLSGVARYLFGALALAVILAMLASWLVAMTVTPNYCARFVREKSKDESGKGLMARLQAAIDRLTAAYERALVVVLDRKALLFTAMAALIVLGAIGFQHLGTEFFPRADSGQYIVNFRAPVGSRIERTDAFAARIEEVVREVVPADELDLIVSNLGVAPGFSAVYSPNSASDSGQVMVSLKPKRRHSTFHYIHATRRALTERIPEVGTLLQPAGIVSSVLCQGVPAPIDVQLNGPDYRTLDDAAQTVARTLRALPEVAQALVAQEARYPTIEVTVDRVQAGRLGLSFKDAADNVITALTSNTMIAPSVWIDPASGNDYFLTAQYPERDIRSVDSLLDIPVRSHGVKNSVLLREIATLRQTEQPSEAAHYDIQRVMDVLVLPHGDDLGGAQEAVERAMAGVKLPPGVGVKYRGEVAAMQSSFADFGPGIVLAVVLLYLVMVAQFRSFIDPTIVLFSVPTGLVGVVATLLVTGTTLNIESLMGVITMIGIAASNAILLVDFANERRREGQGARKAIVAAARVRLRPILMTSLATIIGFLPIALNGHEATAPLARAAGGGLACSTLLTLFLVPAIYDRIYGGREVEARP